MHQQTGRPAQSSRFCVAHLAWSAPITSPSDGDLWPSAWADDGHLYSACGDGLGFSTGPWSDIVVNRITGEPSTGLSGTRLAAGRDISPIWGDPARFNSKPTGMLAVDGNGDGRDELYLAVQDLGYGPGEAAFNEAPLAGIVTSTDYGHTWHHVGPMFTDHILTTVMFLDFGQSQRHARILEGCGTDDGRGYAYAYGLDHNWRTSYSDVVPSPQDLYLMRVPIDKIMDREAWQYYAGDGASPTPRWSSLLADRTAVLHDETLRATDTEPQRRPSTVIAQGGVVFNPGLNCFLYTSWTEHTFEFYEAPLPWGPWRHFLTQDFGPFPWRGPSDPRPKHGGYATTIPSKFISADGRDCFVQSNWFWRASTAGGRSYHFSLRPLHLEPAAPTPTAPGRGTAPQEAPASGTPNLALPGAGAWPYAPACRDGLPHVLNDGSTDLAEDSWTGSARDLDVWGYEWARPVTASRMVFTPGPWDFNGGYFAREPWVEARIEGTWRRLATSVTPTYPCGPTATGTGPFTLTFAPVTTDALRMAGPPGGFEPYTSIAELEVYGPATDEGAPQ